MDNKNVLIMMATFNGEKYLEKQIDSIIAQTYSDWKLLIRDDGSKDGTADILKEYQKKDSRIEVLFNSGPLHGPYHNFHELFYEAKKRPAFEYYAFCDQDDIWKSEKLEKLIKYCNDNSTESEPTFVYTDLSVIDGEGHLTEKSVNQILGIDISENPINLFFAHAYVWGCTALFNQALFSLVPALDAKFPHRDIMSHDNYIAKHAVMYGKIMYYPTPLILYRKHGGNVTDKHKFRLSLATVFKKAVFGFQEVSKTHARVYNQSLLAINVIYKNQKDNSAFEKLKAIEIILRSGGVKGVLGMKGLNIRRKQFSRTVALYVVMIMKSYKKYLF